MTTDMILRLIVGVAAWIAATVVWASLWGKDHPACKPEGGDE